MQVPNSGATGQTLTEVSTTGQVEVDGVTYDAFTNRHTIPAWTEIVVSGWRLEGESKYVLSVRLIGDNGPPLASPTDAVPTPVDAVTKPTTAPDAQNEQKQILAQQAARIRRLEEQLDEQYRPTAPNPLSIIFLYTLLGIGASLVLSCIFYRGPGLRIYPCAIMPWAAGGALIGVIVYLVKAANHRSR